MWVWLRIFSENLSENQILPKNSGFHENHRWAPNMGGNSGPWAPDAPGNSSLDEPGATGLAERDGPYWWRGALDGFDGLGQLLEGASLELGSSLICAPC